MAGALVGRATSAGEAAGIGGGSVPGLRSKALRKKCVPTMARIATISAAVDWTATGRGRRMNGV